MGDTRLDTYTRILGLIGGSMPTLEPSSLNEHSDLYALGMDSTAAISLMLSIEEAFCITFPDSLLDDAIFRTPGSLAVAVNSLLG